VRKFRPDAVENAASRSAMKRLPGPVFERKQRDHDKRDQADDRDADPFGDPAQHQNACPIEI
jgi:hypothetical protein